MPDNAWLLGKPLPTGETDNYLFIFDDNADSYSRLMETFLRFAADPELSFDWEDAARLSARALFAPEFASHGDDAC